jgi:hypothetical protein
VDATLQDAALDHAADCVLRPRREGGKLVNAEVGGGLLHL